MEPSLVAQRLCLQCGLCCSGVLFKDVELQSGDDAERLAALGLPLRVNLLKNRRPRNRSPKDPDSVPPVSFSQPCAGLCADNRCQWYTDRPTRCRTFECALFKEVAVGKVETAAALRTIALARRRAESVRKLLRQLGDANEHLALPLRFRRVKKRIEGSPADAASAGLFGQLSLAMHQLNLLLSQKFYPG